MPTKPRSCYDCKNQTFCLLCVKAEELTSISNSRHMIEWAAFDLESLMIFIGARCKCFRGEGSA